MNSDFQHLQTPDMLDDDEETLIPFRIRNVQNIVCTTSFKEAFLHGQGHVLVID